MGRKPAFDEEQMKTIFEMYEKGATAAELAKKFHVALPTLYRAIEQVSHKPSDKEIVDKIRYFINEDIESMPKAKKFLLMRKLRCSYLKDAQICRAFGVSPQTFSAQLKKHADLTKGKIAKKRSDIIAALPALFNDTCADSGVRLIPRKPSEIIK